MQTFSKSERLCSKVLIEKVFEKGKVVTVPSFKLIWMRSEKKEESPIQIVISVPKRNFKKAVDRNTLKRRIREVYRKNKSSLYSVIAGNTIHIMLIYTGRNMMEYKEAEEKIRHLLQRLMSEVNIHAVPQSDHNTV